MITFNTVRLLLNKMINKKKKLWCQVTIGKLMDYADYGENSSDITEAREGFFMK